MGAAWVKPKTRTMAFVRVWDFDKKRGPPATGGEN
jgi:hypothetical protein